jgi:hypothetical protein
MLGLIVYLIARAPAVETCSVVFHLSLSTLSHTGQVPSFVERKPLPIMVTTFKSLSVRHLARLMAIALIRDRRPHPRG